MGVIDVCIVIILGGFVLFGVWFGLIHTLGSLVGTVFGVFLASRWYAALAALLIRITGWDENISRVVMFVLAFLIINRLVGFAFWMADKLLQIFTRMPFLRSLDRLLGATFGLVEGLFTVGMIVFFIERVPLTDRFMYYLAQSNLAPITTKVVAVLLPFVPDALKTIQSTIDYVEHIVR